MHYEDVKVEKGETVSGLGVAYGYKSTEWRKIWDDPRNMALIAKSLEDPRLSFCTGSPAAAGRILWRLESPGRESREAMTTAPSTAFHGVT